MPTLSHVRRRRVNAILLEGLFFHRSDAPDLYDELFRNRDQFKEFWQEHFGIELIVKNDVAYRRHDNPANDVDGGFKNQNIQKKSRSHFYFRGKNSKLELLVFQRFLYWYETELRRRAPNAYGEFEFTNQEFWSWVEEEITRFFDGRYEVKPHDLHAAYRRVLREVDTYGFIMETDRVNIKDIQGSKPDSFQDDHVIQYLARPGLTTYDPLVLHEDPSVYEKAFGIDAVADGEEE